MRFVILLKISWTCRALTLGITTTKQALRRIRPQKINGVRVVDFNTTI